MNGFNKKPIIKWEKRAERWVKGHLFLTIIIIALGFLTLKGVAGAIKVGKPLSVKQIVVSAVSKGLERDEQGNTNILVIGVGGEGHDGANLTDTMIIASIDYKEDMLPMLSIPRDLFVENDVVGWGTRINGVYEYVYEETGSYERAMEELINEMEKVTGMDIHYYAKIDFAGFKEGVDAIGGIDINLDEEFYDPYYPAPPGKGYEHEPFYLAAGEHTLDGDDALKYARSRKTSSDFDRAYRQQEIINAAREKATSAGVLLNPNRLKKIFASINNNFETNLELSELLNLASLATDFNSDSLLSEVIHDDASSTGGFLYTPDREQYGGAFVLVPFAGDFREIQMFADLYLHNPSIFADGIGIEVLNGTKAGGLAGLTKMFLKRFGFNVVSFQNAANREALETRIMTTTPNDVGDTLKLLHGVIGGEISGTVSDEYASELWPTEAEIIIELGQDFLEFYRENEDQFYLGFY